MNQSSSAKLAELVRLLIKKSRLGEVAWIKTSLENTYEASLGDYTISITEVKRGDSIAPDIQIAVFDTNNVLVESFTDPNLGDFDFDGYDGPFSAMVDLLGMARRHSSGADKALDEIIRLLN